MEEVKQQLYVYVVASWSYRGKGNNVFHRFFTDYTEPFTVSFKSIWTMVLVYLDIWVILWQQ